MIFRNLNVTQLDFVEPGLEVMRGVLSPGPGLTSTYFKVLRQYN